MTGQPWPAMLPVRYVRIARPTDQLPEVVRYREGLGLPELDRFPGHPGYRGVLPGLPGTRHHLEFSSTTSAARVWRRPAATCSCSISAI